MSARVLERDRTIEVVQGMISSLLGGRWQPHTAAELAEGAGGPMCEWCGPVHQALGVCLDSLAYRVADGLDCADLQGAAMAEVAIHAVRRGRHLPKRMSDARVDALAWGNDGLFGQANEWESTATKEEVLRVLELAERCCWRRIDAGRNARG